MGIILHRLYNSVVIPNGETIDFTEAERAWKELLALRDGESGRWPRYNLEEEEEKHAGEASEVPRESEVSHSVRFRQA